jgi:hypothetical protein
LGRNHSREEVTGERSLLQVTSCRLQILVNNLQLSRLIFYSDAVAGRMCRMRVMPMLGARSPEGTAQQSPGWKSTRSGLFHPGLGIGYMLSPERAMQADCAALSGLSYFCSQPRVSAASRPSPWALLHRAFSALFPRHSRSLRIIRFRNQRGLCGSRWAA